MDSTQCDDDLESQPRSEANPSLTMSPTDGEYQSHRDEEGEYPELNATEPSEQEPADSTGHGGSHSTGGGYTPGARRGDSHGTPDTESFALKLTSIIEGITQEVQTTMEGLLSNVNEIDNSALEVIEELQTAKGCGNDRKCKLEADRDEVHRAVCRVLDVLNLTNNMMSMARNPKVGFNREDGDH